MNTPLLNNLFYKCTHGYHIVHNTPIKESVWEDINTEIFIAAGIHVSSQSNGSHQSGADIFCDIGSFSNKSTQYDTSSKNSFKISSYRLTSVCSDKNNGDISCIIAEIERRKNFQYYSIIVRSETDTEYTYDWYIIPADLPQLCPSSYTWTPKSGKQTKTRDTVTGWQTNVIDGSSMSISFSMSSQLWIYLTITDDMKKYSISSCSVKKGKTLNFIQLFDNHQVAV